MQISSFHSGHTDITYKEQTLLLQGGIQQTRRVRERHRQIDRQTDRERALDMFILTHIHILVLQNKNKIVTKLAVYT